MNDKNPESYLFDNEIEKFLKYIKEGNINQGIKYLQKYYSSDPVYCLKLIYFLNS